MKVADMFIDKRDDEIIIILCVKHITLTEAGGHAIQFDAFTSINPLKPHTNWIYEESTFKRIWTPISND